MNIIFVFLSLFLLLTVESKKRCGLKGKCEKSEIVGFEKTMDYEECLSLCNSNNECEWISHDSRTKVCELYSDCESLTDKNCPYCISGQKECFQCLIKGTCEVQSNWITDESTAHNCFLRCKRTKDCNWFNYREKNGTCVMSKSECFLIDQNCPECVTGGPTCSGRFMGTQNLLIAGGHGQSSDLKDVELLNLDDEPILEKCFINNLPLRTDHAFGTVNADGKPVICVIEGNRDCLTYDFTDQNWILRNNVLRSKRPGAAAVYVPNQGWWFTGGTSAPTTSEIIDVKSMTSKDGPGLPNSMFYHCMVNINSTLTFIIGDYQFRDRMFAYDWIGGKFIHISEIREARRYMACGIYGSNVVVAGGEGVSSTELYDFGKDVLNQEWNFGPELPKTLKGASMESVHDHLFLIGGYTDNIASESIYEFSYAEWIELKVTLKTPRKDFDVMLVSNKINNCEL